MRLDRSRNERKQHKIAKIDKGERETRGSDKWASLWKNIFLSLRFPQHSPTQTQSTTLPTNPTWESSYECMRVRDNSVERRVGDERRQFNSLPPGDMRCLVGRPAPHAIFRFLKICWKIPLLAVMRHESICSRPEGKKWKRGVEMLEAMNRENIRKTNALFFH